MSSIAKKKAFSRGLAIISMPHKSKQILYLSSKACLSEEKKMPFELSLEISVNKREHSNYVFLRIQ